MNYKIGKYVIQKKATWTHEKATLLTIVDINKELDEITYYYDAQENKLRCRDFDDFEKITLIPCSPLMEELF